MGIAYGWHSPLFALAAGLAAVVMYDAFNVRWSTGEQAKALNQLLGSLEDLPPDLKGRRLKEALGHTPFQVLMGALLGISVGLLTALEISAARSTRSGTRERRSRIGLNREQNGPHRPLLADLTDRGGERPSVLNCARNWWRRYPRQEGIWPPTWVRWS